MITAQEGYFKIISKHPLDKLDACLDMGNFWLYIFRPVDMSDDEKNLCGTIFDAVRKRDGRCYMYDILSKPDAFRKAKKVEVKDIYSSKFS